ncbi:hypothetical protein [Listeria newyorkensis]|uniref:Uncharacterized protein n=1 Tax=Listeria newyorkensis TaxID=1497681 RepID=A0A841Z1L2_9LIST|nr:hypothetical protein [Listeria newyorkensis]MBC1458717.1 hypothetical protein [Listeria newyorkensis]
MKKWIFAIVAMISVIFASCLFVFSDATKADDTTAKLNLATLGSYKLDSRLFETHSIEQSDLSTSKMESYDGLLITADYIHEVDQKRLKEEIRDSKLPVLFADFMDKSSVAFSSTELSLQEIEMLDKGEVQMIYTLPSGELATYGIFDTDRTSLKQLSKAISKVTKVKDLKEWEIETASMLVN